MSARRQDPGRCARAEARGAFTLIELLVVIAIILILAALILPLANSAVRQARGAQCVSNVGQIGKAMMSYLKDNKFRFPLYQRDTTEADHEKRKDWTSVTLPYVPNREIFMCPSRQPVHMGTSAGDKERGITFPINYGLCYTIHGKLYTSFDSPSQLGYVADAGHDRFYNNEGTWGLPQVRSCAVHSERAGVVFADAHAELVKKEDVTPEMFTP